MNRTLQNIKNWTSLNNLKKGKPTAQIATLLLLIITTMLIFTLVVVNLGQVSTYTTNLSNAADSASLYFASQLGTKAYQLSMSLYNSCGNAAKCCVKTGLLSIVLAIILVIIAIVVTIISFGGTSPFLAWAVANAAIVIAGAAVVGAIGGAIGGAIAGTGALQGAIQGAMIGAAIGAGVVGGAGALGSPFALIDSLPGALVFSSTTGAIVGASLGVTLVAAANIYTAYAKDAMLGDAMAAAAKALSGLPETLRIREGVFLQALSETIDDPTKIVDDIDSDGDGDTTELVPKFQYCWDRRIASLKGQITYQISDIETAINEFLFSSSGPVQTFLNATDQFLPHLSRQEVEGADGTVTLLLRALEEDFGYTVSFWDKGPTGAELEAWKNWDPLACPTCEPPEPPAGYDELDYDIDELGDLYAEVEEFRAQITYDLAKNWRQWVIWFYDPEQSDSEADDYYRNFYRMVEGDQSSIPVRIGLNGWTNEIETIRQSLLVCVYGSYSYDEYGNIIDYTCNACGLGACSDCLIGAVPCRWHPFNPNFGTIDLDLDDEFQAAKDVISEFIPHIEAFRQACKEFYERMVSLEGSLDSLTPSACNLEGINPVTYKWKDSRGNHYVKAEISSYNTPRLVKKKYGNWLKGKKCIELLWGEQDLSVNMERKDPANVSVGVLGEWNPYYGGKIGRSSTSRYRGFVGSDWVKVVGR